MDKKRNNQFFLMKKKSSFHPALNPFLYYATSKARIRFWVYTQNTTNSLCCFLSVIYGADAYLSQPWPKNPTKSPIFLDQQSFAYFWKSHTRTKKIANFYFKVTTVCSVKTLLRFWFILK